VHGERAGRVHHAGGVVVAAGARPGDQHDQIGVPGGLADGRGDQLGVVGDDVGGPRVAADLGGLGGQHQRVGVGDVAGSEVGADRADLVAGRDDHHPGPAPDGQLDRAGGGARGDVDRAQPVPFGQQQFGGADVLADRADVLVGRHGGAQLGPAVRGPVHVLAHDDRVVAGRERITGVDDVEVGQPDRRRLRGADGVRGQDRDPVHRGGVEGGRGAARPHRLGGDPPQRPGHRHPHHVHPRRAPGGRARLPPRPPGLLGGDVRHERRPHARTVSVENELAVINRPCRSRQLRSRRGHG
jgi:hypothetical protein